MKKLSLVIIGAMLISLVACQKENITEEVVTPEAILQQDDITAEGKASGEFCKFTLQLNARSVLHPITGKQTCQPDPGSICAIVECFPDPSSIIELPPFIWDPCQLVPCGLEFIDPWILVEKLDPREFRSIKDVYELRLDEKSEAIPFVMGENLLGAQFYAQPQRQSDVFYLENKIVLDREIAKKLGLKGNIIGSGKYPVIFNKENKTYNVLFIIETGF